jgi:hypothetical protein
MAQERHKTSVAMTERTQTALDRLRLRLLSAGVPRSVASVSAIIEALVAHADFDLLLDKLSR